MENKKENFVMYHNIYPMIEELSDEEVGNVIRNIFEYSINGTLPEYERGSAMSLLFKNIKNSIDISNKKYKERCERNKENIQKRWDINKQDAFKTSYNRSEEYDCFE